jgi:alpha-L-rhamnosidase
LKAAPTKEMVTGIVLNSDIQRTGEWKSNDALLNQLQHNIWWGQKGNFLEVPTDCPQRDERLGWTGDAQFSCEPLLSMPMSQDFLRSGSATFATRRAQMALFRALFPTPARWMTTTSSAMAAPPGRTQPSFVRGRIIWSTATNAFWKTITKVSSATSSTLDDISRPHGLIRSHPDSKVFGGFGDWLSTDTQDSFGTTRKDLIGTAFFAYSSH